jgi:Cu+-exporting ATPase
MPVMKKPGDPMWAGTRNGNGLIRLRIEAAGHETMLSRIQELVRQAQRAKSALQRKVDVAAGWFVPIMLVLSLLTLLLWGLAIRPGDWNQAFICSIAVLLAACPCALGLAAPISLVIASGHMARQGIVAKETGALERLAGVETLVIDKTGTLTEGRPRLGAVLDLQGGENRLLRLAAAAEAESVHPLAGAIRQEAKKRGLVVPLARQHKYQPGGGVEAVVEGKSFALGNARFAAERGIKANAAALAFAAAQERSGHTVLYAALDGQTVGILAFKDTIKPQARTAIMRLKRMGLQVELATGDHEAPARAAALDAGIATIHASMLPEAKVNLIERLKQQGKRVAMAGDGWNDAPALAAADVGLAMGDGSRAALSAGHMTLLFSRLEAIPEAIRISRLTLRNVRQNLAFAFGYNALIIPLAAIGLLEPWMAGTAMAMSSVSVVGNALRLSGRLRSQKKREKLAGGAPR